MSQKSVKDSINVGANMLAVTLDTGLTGNPKKPRESRLLGRPTRLTQ